MWLSVSVRKVKVHMTGLLVREVEMNSYRFTLQVAFSGYFCFKIYSFSSDNLLSAFLNYFGF